MYKLKMTEDVKGFISHGVLNPVLCAMIDNLIWDSDFFYIKGTILTKEQIEEFVKQGFLIPCAAPSEFKEQVA